MTPFKTLGIPLLAALATTACTGLGTVPRSLVGIYDQASPTGIIELEIDRDGTIREMEGEIDTELLPPMARDVALNRLQGAEIVGAEREITTAGDAWEVKLRHEGRAWEIVVDGEGKIIETEKELSREEAPPEVLEAATRAIPASTFMSVEVVQRGEHEEYHVKRVRAGATYKVVLAPDGTVTRKVREHRAEIEIPLQ